MDRQRLCVVLLVASLLGLVVRAAEKPPENYQRAMQTLGVFAGAIDKAIAAEDYAAVTKLAVPAREAFVVTESYWTGKSSDAKQIAQAAGKAMADLVTAAGLTSREGVEYSAAEVKSSCAACHMAHRESQPDGSFLIK